MELTTASLAMSPVSSATAACHAPNPMGANTGAINPPTMARMLSAVSSTIRKSVPKLWRNHTATLMAAMMVPARVRKSRTRSHTWSQMFCRVGIRYGGSSSRKGAGSP